MDELNLSTVNAEPEANVEPQNNEAVTEESVQTNNAEVVEPQQTNELQQKTTQSPEENAKYASIRREAEAKARDKVIADMGMEWNGQPITTYDQYVKAKAESDQYQLEQKLRSEYESKGLPEDVVEELVESKKFREQLISEQKAKEQQIQQQKDLQDFITEFPDVKPDDIPAEVWQANAQGIPLKYAYSAHALKLAKEAEAKAKANAENAKGSMGSVTGDGVANETDFISYNAYEKNKTNQSWVNKNFDKIMKSRTKW